jgi:outer membrane protein OmpA-like peptidoglycan-associated protein
MKSAALALALMATMLAGPATGVFADGGVFFDAGAGYWSRAVSRGELFALPSLVGGSLGVGYTLGALGLSAEAGIAGSNEGANPRFSGAEQDVGGFQVPLLLKGSYSLSPGSKLSLSPELFAGAVWTDPALVARNLYAEGSTPAEWGLLGGAGLKGAWNVSSGATLYIAGYVDYRMDTADLADTDRHSANFSIKAGVQIHPFGSGSGGSSSKVKKSSRGGRAGTRPAAYSAAAEPATPAAPQSAGSDAVLLAALRSGPGMGTAKASALSDTRTPNSLAYVLRDGGLLDAAMAATPAQAEAADAELVSAEGTAEPAVAELAPETQPAAVAATPVASQPVANSSINTVSNTPNTAAPGNAAPVAAVPASAASAPAATPAASGARMVNASASAVPAAAATPAAAPKAVPAVAPASAPATAAASGGTWDAAALKADIAALKADVIEMNRYLGGSATETAAPARGATAAATPAKAAAQPATVTAPANAAATATVSAASVQAVPTSSQTASTTSVAQPVAYTSDGALSGTIYYRPDETRSPVLYSIPTLDAVGKKLHDNQALTVTVRGYAAAAGTVYGQRAVSEQRAKYCADYLNLKWEVAYERMRLEWYGAARKPGSAGQYSDESYNRAVDLVLSGE